MKEKMLKLDNIQSGYGSMQVLWGASLEVKGGSVTALLGPNGTGKTTLLKTILGTVMPWSGCIIYNERDITHLPPYKKVGMNIVLVPEGRHLFTNMTTYENLLMGAYQKEALIHRKQSIEMVYSLFPVLKERAGQKAGTLSGGEQQMLTIGRGLMSRPRFMMLDEPSQGLAPKLVKEVFSAIEKMRREIEITILIVEQNVEYSLSISDYAYIMHEGKIKAEGSAQEIKGAEVRKIYLGI